MNSREDLLKLIFPEPYESYHAEGQFNSCFSDFAQCFLLSCCLENGKKSKRSITHLQSACTQMLESVFLDSIRQPAECYISDYDENRDAIVGIQNVLYDSTSQLQEIR